MLGERVDQKTFFGKSDLIVLALLLLIAAAFRFPALDSPGYGLDELWTTETAVGNGSAHLKFPVNQILQPPQIFQRTNAPPWWNVWTHMEVTHPPLYYILLRLWMNAFGQGDQTERLFAVISSLIAITLLFDATRLTSGRAVAFWACLLFAVAPLQIDFARKTRNYALVLVTLLATTDALVRIEKLGISRWRLLGLLLGTLATPLTHYLSIGAVAGFSAYAAVRFKGRTRVTTLGIFVLAAVLFTITWGPFFYQQRSLFSVDDPGVSFVKDVGPGHFLRVLNLLLLAPAKLLVPRLKLNVVAYTLALLYVVPFLLLRRRPDLLIWVLWLLGDLGGLAILDASRSSLHLGFVRYILMAGPAVYVLIPLIAAAVPRPVWLMHAVSAAVVVLCLCFIRDGYFDPAADPHLIVEAVKPTVSPSDVVVFASRGDFEWTRGVQAMMLIRYLRPIPCPILFLDGPAPEPVRAKLLQAHSVVIFSSSDSPSTFLPGFKSHGTADFPSWGAVSVMAPE